MPAKKIVTPCVQVAVDTMELRDVSRVCEALAHKEGLIIEAGTPTIKQFGIGIVGQMKKMSGDAFIIADLKTMDVGDLEAKIAALGGADAAICSGIAGKPTTDSFISECRKRGILSVVDLMGVKDANALLRSLAALPVGVSFHRNINAELSGEMHAFGRIAETRRAFPGILIASAGGIDPQSARQAVAAGADIVVVGRFITAAGDPADALAKIQAAISAEMQAKAR